MTDRLKTLSDRAEALARDLGIDSDDDVIYDLEDVLRRERRLALQEAADAALLAKSESGAHLSNGWWFHWLRVRAAQEKA